MLSFLQLQISGESQPLHLGITISCFLRVAIPVVTHEITVLDEHELYENILYMNDESEVYRAFRRCADQSLDDFGIKPKDKSAYFGTEYEVPGYNENPSGTTMKVVNWAAWPTIEDSVPLVRATPEEISRVVNTGELINGWRIDKIDDDQERVEQATETLIALDQNRIFERHYLTDQELSRRITRDEEDEELSSTSEEEDD